MKIIPGKYPEARDWQNYVIFDNIDEQEISAPFLWRIARWVKDTFPGRKIHLASGWRTYAKQQDSYAKWPTLAAKPGKSFHQYRCAADVANVSKDMVLPDSKFTWSQQKMLKYGIYIPMNDIDGVAMGVIEFWHLAPIESKGVQSSSRIDWLMNDDIVNAIQIVRPTLPNLAKPAIGSLSTQKPAVTLLQRLLVEQRYMKATDAYGKPIAWGWFGAQTKAAVLAFQKAKGMKQTGLVDKACWIKLLGYVNKAGQTGAAAELVIKFLYLYGFIPDPKKVMVDAPILTAIKWFQGVIGLPQDGSIGPTSWDFIYRFLQY